MLTLLSLACTQICKKHVWVPIWEDTISLELSPLQFPSQMPFQLPFCSQFQYAVVSWKGKGPEDTFEQSTSSCKMWQYHSDTIDLSHPCWQAAAEQVPASMPTAKHCPFLLSVPQAVFSDSSLADYSLPWLWCGSVCIQQQDSFAMLCCWLLR